MAAGVVVGFPPPPRPLVPLKGHSFFETDETGEVELVLESTVFRRSPKIFFLDESGKTVLDYIDSLIGLTGLLFHSPDQCKPSLEKVGPASPSHLAVTCADNQPSTLPHPSAWF